MKNKKSGPKKIEKPAKETKSVNVKSNENFQYFQEILESKRADILQAVKHKEESVTLGEIGDEADAASQTFEREMLYEMANGDRSVLDSVEAALRKIEKGDYGLCESCHKKILTNRLKAMPWARYCIECQAKAETPSSAY